MKKIILSVIVITAITFTACKKGHVQPQAPQTQINSNDIDVSSKNNRLVFKTEADYLKAITNPTNEQSAKFLETIASFSNFSSYSNSNIFRRGIDNGINDDFFESILNPDLIVQIGDYIYKVNPVTEKVYALPAINENQYSDLLSENINNQNIKVYSTADNIIPSRGEEAQRGIICRESGIGSKDAFIGPIDVGNYKMSFKLHFNRFGIYYKLFAEAYTTDPSYVSLKIDMDPVYYHVRCDETVNYISYDNQASNADFFISYQGAKNLNELWFRGRVKGTANNQTVISDWIELRQNY